MGGGSGEVEIIGERGEGAHAGQNGDGKSEQSVGSVPKRMHFEKESRSEAQKNGEIRENLTSNSYWEAEKERNFCTMASSFLAFSLDRTRCGWGPHASSFPFLPFLPSPLSFPQISFFYMLSLNMISGRSIYFYILSL